MYDARLSIIIYAHCLRNVTGEQNKDFVYIIFGHRF
jgi:hypothetical protein